LGHIIITSRDEAAVGSVALQGSVVGNLTVEEAVHILIARSLAHMVTPEDMIDAEAIVESLGCLLLAVDQAGAYIRARQKH
jgi:septum formation inhibitor-activating ATPase MinD